MTETGGESGRTLTLLKGIRLSTRFKWIEFEKIRTVYSLIFHWIHSFYSCFHEYIERSLEALSDKHFRSNTLGG